MTHPARRDRVASLALVLGIALYGNAFALIDSVPQLSLGWILRGALLCLASVLLARRSGSDWLAELGLRPDGLGPSLRWGLLLGLALGLPGCAYLLWPDLVPVPISYAALRESGPSAFLTLVLLKIPFATALAEELAFRGLLQARLRAAFGARAAVLIGAVAFGAWHFVVNYTTLQGTNLAADATLAWLAYLGQTVSVLVAGLLFGLLRERSGNLAGCVLAHWLVDVLLVTGVYWAATPA